MLPELLVLPDGEALVEFDTVELPVEEPDGEALVELDTDELPVDEPDGEALVVEPEVLPPGPTLLELPVLLLIMLVDEPELADDEPPPGALDVAVPFPPMLVSELPAEGVLDELLLDVPVYAPLAPNV